MISIKSSEEFVDFINHTKDKYKSILVISARILYIKNIINEFKLKCNINFVFYGDNKNSYNIISGFEGDLNDLNQRGKVNGWKAEALPWRQR